MYRTAPRGSPFCFAAITGIYKIDMPALPF